MSSIDNRVVQMQFDNKQFEEGIQKSLKSLEELRKGLDLKGATEGIKNIEKAVNGFDVSGIGKSVEAIAGHFTWLGRTIDHELDRITAKAITAGEQMVKSLTIEQIGSGWDKYEDKTRSVATIMSATGKTVDEVNTSLEKLNWFTDETSYNFTDMVNNVGKFTSVGVDLDDAVTAMQGIANAAALSGGGVNEASRAMYNFSQAMGTGKLLLADWRSIELANMATVDFKNALIESGLAMGTLVKQGGGYITTTEDGTGAVKSFTDANEGFRDSLSSGWITTEVMMDTFKKYGQYADEIYKITESEGITAAEAMDKFSDSSMDLGERAFKAAQEARTFTDAINATKDAVSTGWMQSFEIIFGNYEQAREMWTDLANTLWDVFAGGAESRNELLSEVFQSSKDFVNSQDWATLSKELPMGDAFQKAIMETARSHGIAIDQMIEEEGSFAETLDKSWLTVDLLNETLNKTYGSSSNASEGIENNTEKLEKLNKVAQEVIAGKYGNNADRIKKLTEAGYDYAEVQWAVNKILKGGALTYEDLSKAELENLGYTEEEIAQLQDIKKAASESGTALNELLNGGDSRVSGRELAIEAISNAFNGLMSVIGAIKEAWSNIFPPMTADRLYSIIEAINKFSKNLIPTEETTEKLTRAFSGLFSVLSIVGQAISSIIKGVSSVAGRFLKPVSDWLLDSAARIGDAFTFLSRALKESEAFSRIVNGIFEVFEIFGEKLSGIWNAIVGSFDLSGALDPIKSKWKQFKKWLVSNGGISGVIDSFFELVKGWARGIDATKIGLAIRKFITDLRTKFKGLSSINGYLKTFFDPIIKFFEDIYTKFSGSFSNVVSVISQWIKDLVSGFGKGFSGIETGVGSAFENVRNAIGKGIEFIGNIFDSGLKFIKEKLTPLVEFIKTVLLVQTLLRINGFIKSISGVFTNASNVISSVSNFIDTFSESLSKLTKAKTRDLNATALLKVAGAIGILVAAVFVLTNVVDPTRVYDALTVIGVLFVELAGGLYLLDKALGTGTAKGTKKISGFLGLALGILVLVHALNKLAKMDIEDIKRGMIEVGALMIELAAFTRLANKDFKFSNGAALLAMALSLQLFVLAMLELAKMKPETAIKGLIGLGLLLTEVGIFTRLSSKNMKFSNGIGLMGMALSLQLFVLAMLEIAKMKPETAVKGLIGLGVLLTEIGVFTRLASKNIKFSNGMALISMATSLIIFASAIKKIGSIDSKSLVKGLAGMGVAIFEISKLTKSMSKMSISSGIGSLIGMASLLSLIPLIKAFSRIPNAGEVGVGLGVAIAGIGVGIQALSKVGGIAGGFSAAGALVSFAVTLGAIIAVVETIAGLIAKIKGSGEFLDGASEILTKIGEGIGGFIGGITSQVIGGVGRGLEQIGTNLSNFWTNASIFIEGVKGIKEEDLSGVGALSTAVLKLTASEFLDALTKLVGGGEQNLATFGNELVILGPALSSFSDEAKKVDSDAVANAANALGAIANIPIPSSGGLLQEMIGETNFEAFGTQLASLGPDLASFAQSVSGVSDYSGIIDAAKALSALVAVDIDPTGGFVEAIVGRTDWAIFGEQLASFGPSFRTFADSVNGIEVNGLSNAASGLESLLSINAPHTDWGIIDIFTGTTDWGKFGTQLEQFGNGFKQFAGSMSGITEESLSGVNPAVDSMKKLLEIDIPKSDGFFQWLVGKKDLGDFGDNLGRIGAGFNTFNTNVKDVNVENLTAMVGLIERLGTFAGNISGTIVEDIENFGTAISMIGAGDIDMSAAVSAIASWSDDFASSGEDLAESLETGLGDHISSQAYSIAVNLNEITSAFSLYSSLFTASGITLAAAFVTGMDNKKSSTQSEGKALASSAITGIRNQRAAAVSSGQYIAGGFISGMNSKHNDVSNSAKALADVANSAFRNRLQISSPSRVMERNGAYFVDGFIRALQNRSKNVEDASAGVATSALGSFDNILSIINGVLNNSIELRPTIRPVVDLSDLNTAAGNINSIFSTPQTIGLGGYNNPFIPSVLSQINSNMNGYGSSNYQQTDNSDVIQAIRDLGEEFVTMKEAITNMKLVMETGALVGQIKGEMDKQLGRKVSMKSRGV